jgi:hypothetical protein
MHRHISLVGGRIVNSMHLQTELIPLHKNLIDYSSFKLWHFRLAISRCEFQIPVKTATNP